MTRRPFAMALAGVLLLGACGADGPPIRPTASFGVGIGTGGATTTATVGATNGIAQGSFTLGLRR